MKKRVFSFLLVLALVTAQMQGIAVAAEAPGDAMTEEAALVEVAAAEEAAVEEASVEAAAVDEAAAEEAAAVEEVSAGEAAAEEKTEPAEAVEEVDAPYTIPSVLPTASPASPVPGRCSGSRCSAFSSAGCMTWKSGRRVPAVKIPQTMPTNIRNR